MGNIEKYGVAALAVIILMIVVISILDLRDSGKLTGGDGTVDNPTKVKIARDPGPGEGDPLQQKPLSVPNRWGETNETTIETKLVAGAQTYAVQDGDTLAKIAKQAYGDSQYHHLISQANPGINPNALQVGTVLQLPALGSGGGSSTPAPVSGARSHVVRKGETLGEISQKHLGTAKRWREIMKINGMKSERLKVGQELKIPTH